MTTLRHEAADRVHVLFETFAAHVAEHPAVTGDPTLLGKAQDVITALSALYQAIGGAE